MKTILKALKIAFRELTRKLTDDEQREYDLYIRGEIEI